MSPSSSTPLSHAELVAEHAGYKNAYDILLREVGILRSTAAPVVRKDLDKIDTALQPSIFLVTLPKSATVYIANSLAQSLGYDFSSTLVTPTFPKNIIWSNMLTDFRKGRMISVSHMQPDAANFDLLDEMDVYKGVLHLRDPRAALISWMHFLSSREETETRYRRIHRRLRRRPLTEQVDAVIELSFRDFVDWTVSWLERLQREPEKWDFLVVTHDELVRDERAYFQKILTHYGMNTEIRGVEKNAATHFRKGDNDDWRTTLSTDQTARVNELIPDILWDRFGWRP